MGEGAEGSGAGGRPQPVLDEPQKQAIQRELERILESPAFRTTKRSQQCLRFVVERSLEGETDRLKERCIGVEVFGRAPDYDTNTDAVVRISANDLRKRLAQYEMNAGSEDGVRITLPPGSYVPEFHWRNSPAPEAAPPSDSPSSGPPAVTRVGVALLRRIPVGRLVRNWMVYCVAGAVLLAALVLGVVRWATRESPLEQFWGPVLKSPSPAVIAIGQSTVYLLSQRVHQLYDRGNSEEAEGGPHIARYGEASIPGRDIIPVPDLYTGVNDALALARLTEMFARFGKPVKIRFGEETSFSDMRDAPMVLLGFNNRWNRDVAREFRFSFGRSNEVNTMNEVKTMKDSTPPGRTWTVTADPAGHTVTDYGLISRILNTATGQFIVQAGGVASYGTRAAGEFLTSSEHWDRLLHDLPRDWPTRNLQVVIRVQVIRNTPSVPEVVAVHCW